MMDHLKNKMLNVVCYFVQFGKTKPCFSTKTADNCQKVLFLKDTIKWGYTDCGTEIFFWLKFLLKIKKGRLSTIFFSN